MISHVMEFRLLDRTDPEAKTIQKSVLESLQALGYDSSQVEFHLVPAGVSFQWGIPDLGDDKPSEAQVGYARRLYADLKSKAKGDTPIAVCARQLAVDVALEMASGNVTKQAMSPIIDNMKLAIADLDYERVGVCALND